MNVSVRPLSVVQKIAAALREAIAAGELSPGDRIIEKEISERFEVSRGPVREAISLLTTEEVLERIPHKGAQVAKASREDMMNSLFIMSRLEGLAAYQAASHIDRPGVRETLEQRLKRARVTALSREDIAKGRIQSIRLKTNTAIHDAIYWASDNPRLKLSINRLERPAYRAAYFLIAKADDWELSCAEHDEIIRFILEGESEAAEQAMIAHVNRTRKAAEALPADLFAPR